MVKLAKTMCSNFLKLAKTMLKLNKTMVKLAKTMCCNFLKTD